MVKPEHERAEEYARGLAPVYEHTYGADMVANLAAAYLETCKKLGEAEALLREISNWRCGQEYEESYDGIPCAGGDGRNVEDWCAPCRAKAYLDEHGIDYSNPDPS